MDPHWNQGELPGREMTTRADSLKAADEAIRGYLAFGGTGAGLLALICTDGFAPLTGVTWLVS